MLLWFSGILFHLTLSSQNFQDLAKCKKLRHWEENKRLLNEFVSLSSRGNRLFQSTNTTDHSNEMDCIHYSIVLSPGAGILDLRTSGPSFARQFSRQPWQVIVWITCREPNHLVSQQCCDCKAEFTTDLVSLYVLVNICHKIKFLGFPDLDDMLHFETYGQVKRATSHTEWLIYYSYIHRRKKNEIVMDLIWPVVAIATKCNRNSKPTLEDSSSGCESQMYNL